MKEIGPKMRPKNIAPKKWKKKSQKAQKNKVRRHRMDQ